MEADASSAPVKAPPVDRKMWAAFERGFSQVQFLLDHNRLLINEINQNHESKVPESLTRNVVLIRELNKNIGQVVDLYSNISSSFVKSFDNTSEADSSAQLPAAAATAAAAPPPPGASTPPVKSTDAATPTNSAKSPVSGHKRVRSS